MEAERAFLFATADKSARTEAHANLALFYLNFDRKDEARKHYELAIETESDPALRAYRKGELLFRLHRNDRAKMIEARSHFEQALSLHPQLAYARQRLEQLNKVPDIP